MITSVALAGGRSPESTVSRFYPVIPEAPTTLFPSTDPEVPAAAPERVTGLKNWEIQQTHIKSAIEKRPSFPPELLGPPSSSKFLSKTKLTSDGL